MTALREKKLIRQPGPRSAGLPDLLTQGAVAFPDESGCHVPENCRYGRLWTAWNFSRKLMSVTVCLRGSSGYEK